MQNEPIYKIKYIHFHDIRKPKRSHKTTKHSYNLTKIETTGRKKGMIDTQKKTSLAQPYLGNQTSELIKRKLLSKKSIFEIALGTKYFKFIVIFWSCS